MDEHKPDEPPSKPLLANESKRQRLREKKTITGDALDRAERTSYSVIGRHDVSDEEKQSIFRAQADGVYEKLCATDSHTCAEDLGQLGIGGADHCSVYRLREIPTMEQVNGETPIPALDPARNGGPRTSAMPNADFTIMDWFGTPYKFAPGIQAKAVKCLYLEWKRTGMGLHQKTIGKEAGAEDGFRMDLAFRNHPAYKRMIQPCGDGIYCLCPPDSKPKPTKKIRKR